MSQSTVVVLQSGDGAQHSDQEKADITSTIQQALQERANPTPDQPGPIKQILAHQSRLYSYINWKDPIHTLGLYIGALGFLFGVHYLPLTRLALKAGLTTLGLVSVAEFTSRCFSSNSLSTRLRPKEYRKIAESTLNATLKDVHDLLQYTVVQVQRIVFGQDLDKTFGAFLTFTALYWLSKIVAPFWLSVMGLTMLFLAPLVTSPQGHEMARDASARAQELTGAAAEKSKVLAQDGQAKVAELSSKGKQTASGLSARASGRSSELAESAAENTKKLPQMGSNAINDTSRSVASTFGRMKGYISGSSATSTGKDSKENRSATTGATNNVSDQSNGPHDSVKHMAPGGSADKQQVWDHLRDAHSTLPGQSQTGLGKRDPVVDASFRRDAPGH